METEPLIVEDLLLLLLDDATGTPAGAGTLHYALGGAVLVELALRGRIEADGRRPGLSGAKVQAVGDGPLGDPLLQDAYDKVAERPLGVQSLLLDIGSRLYKPLVERLLDRGLIRRESKKVLGLFRVTTLPAAEDDRHEAVLRERLRAVLVDGAEPDPRTAAIAALLSASGVLPSLHRDIPWSGAVYHRAKDLENGSWGASAVGTAVTRTAAAIAASTTAVVLTVVT